MDDSALDRLFSGDLDKLTQLPKRVVRLFISSTFTDMTLERNTLMERVYPRLKKYCRERHSLDFQDIVVDMRWGVRDEATDDHQTVNLCSREIDNCQRMSLGPNFVALLGDKYGFRPLCSKIKSAEYRALRRCLIELDIKTDFLDTWYKEDLNAVPPEYLLQPISSILKNFTNKNEPELQSVDQRIWLAIQERLHELLMIGSSRLVKQGRMSEQEQLMKYSISVTEREVIEGCLDVNDAKSQCLVYVRSILDIQTHLEKCLASLSPGSLQQLDYDASVSQERKDSQARKASLKIGGDTISLTTSGAQNAAERRVEKNRKLLARYIDLSSRNNTWKIDDEARKALANLKEVKLETKLKANGKNLTKYKVLWNEHDGISLKSDEHKHYLNELTDHFYAHMTRMIRKASRHEQKSKSGLIGEVLQHSHYAKHVSKTFHGRADELDKIRSYIWSSNEMGDIILPMFLYGVGGSGKTAILARAATLSRDWILSGKSGLRTGYVEERWDQKPCIIMRFCCTTPSSSSMVGVLTSVCRQLQFNFYQYGPLNGVVNDTNQNGINSQSSPGADKNNLQLPYQPIPEDFVRLVFTFRLLLDNCQHYYHRQRLFLIILDSVERLSSPAESSVEVKYSWLTSIAKLPPNVRLIVSCSSEKTSESWSEDYQHLKRHFLQSYFACMKRWEQQDCYATENNTSVVNWSSTYKTRNIIDPALDLVLEAQQNITEQTKGGEKYDLLKRLMIPAIRLKRGSIKPDPSTSSEDHLIDRAKIQGKVTTWATKWCLSTGRPRSVSPSIELGSRPLSRKDSSSPVLSYRSRSYDEFDDDAFQQPISRRGVWIIHVRPMGSELALNVVQRWLSGVGRILTRQQWSIVEKSFTHCSRPIFVKLAFGEIVNWKSYSIQSDTKGLTFGSSLLENKRELLAGADGLIDPLFMKLLEEVGDNEADELKWQILSMEQQWLNYLDHKQRKQQTIAKCDETNKQDEGSVVITVGTLGGTKSTTGASSLSNASICHLSNTIEDAICQLFARIELQHGYILTKHSLSYITAARNGICENELEDILSLDDVVLDDVFQYHLPPVRRIPPLLWTRIRNDLPDFLSERDADGIVVNWHHSQFKQVTQKRYLSDPQQVFYIHSTMADYFLGKWADKAKPFRCTKQQIQMAAEQLESAVQQSIRDSQTFGQTTNSRATPPGVSRGLANNNGSMGVRSGASFSVRSRLRSSDQQNQRLQWMQAKANRRVSHQPLCYSSSSNQATNNDELGSSHHEVDGVDGGGGGSIKSAEKQRKRYNMRKLTELPYHLMRSGRFLDLTNEVLFNYKWLFAALDALGLQCLLTDFNEASQSLEKALQDFEKCENDSGNSSTQISSQTTTEYPLELGESAPGLNEFDADLLRSMIKQLSVLNNTIRLSCSAIHSDTQMLAPQLIGRLLPLIKHCSIGPRTSRSFGAQKTAAAGGGDVNYLAQLLDQCDKDGCSDCALLPIDHCLQSPDGLQLSSLEGHSFAIMSMCMAADQRHLLAVSNRFIMWDISTGEVSRDVDPKIDGSIMKQLKMGLNNEYAVAYTSNNLILVLDILTQQVTKFNRLEQHHIIGIDLVDLVGATRFVVWTKSKWFVLRVLNNELNESASSVPRDRITIELEYSVDLAEIGGVFEQILGVHQISSSQVHELTFVKTSVGENPLRLELLTVEAVPGEEPAGWQFKLWNQRVEARTLSLDPFLKQLVFSNSLGDIYLSRRRSTCWSKPKLIRSNPKDVPDCGNLVDQLNSMIDDTAGRIEAEAASIPLAIELDSYCDPKVKRDGPQHLLAVGLSRVDLAQFERQIDALQPNDEIEENCVFEHDNELDGVQQTTRKRKLRMSSTGVQRLKLYFTNKIVVLCLDRKNTTMSGAQEQAKLVERCLDLPRNVRNISVEPNKCQIKCIIVENGLVAAVGRRLLIYSLDSEQFLKCIDAHSARIVQLVPILGSSSGIASASMDKTVKIWNLSNLDKDIHALDKLDNSIESICLSAQRPLAACLARGVLGIWDWRTLKLVTRLTPSLLPGGGTNGGGGGAGKGQSGSERFVKCQFSVNSRYLCLATLNTIHLLSIDDGLGFGSQNIPGARSKSTTDELDLRTNFKYRLPTAGLVRRLKFFLQDSRLLTTLECHNQQQSKRPDSNTENGSSTRSNSSSASNSTDPPSWRLTRRLLTFCHSVPDGRLLYTIDHYTPTTQPTSDSHYLSLQTTAAVSGQTRRRSVAVEPNGGCGGGSEMASTSALETRRGDSSPGHRIRLPVMTRDQLHIVTVETDLTMPIGGDGGAIGGKDAPNSRDTNRASSLADRRKSSGVIRPPISLNVYSARDGLLVRSINLNQLDTYNAAQVNQKQRASINSVTGEATTSTKLAPSAPDGSRRGDIAMVNKQVSGGGALPASQSEAAQISIGCEQFSRLKAVIYRERQSIVALIDDDKGSSYLIDVYTKQLMACSSLWNGKLSADGRFGLSRMFKSSALRANNCNASTAASASAAVTASASASAAAIFSAGGLQLLEMRRCSPIRSLLTNETLSKLLSVSEVHRTTGSDTDITCGFTRPNDSYVYYYDSRLHRLLLIRLADDQLIANYKPSASVTKIKCSTDGCALILGLADGSLTSLAIVDPQKNDSLVRLSQYPSRKRVR